MEKEEKALWDKCVAFHGHACGGLTIGYKAALLAARLLDVGFSQDEEVVCICENDACGVDAIQVVLGCTAGKGNLLFRLRGKQAFTFFSRNSGKGVRLILKKRPSGLSREESFRWLQSVEPVDLFEQQEAGTDLPEPARIFGSQDCAVCGESTAEHMLHVQGGRLVCKDCFSFYNRFDI
jgi:formylmethanofuran dehydrogenase subunit E